MKKPYDLLFGMTFRRWVVCLSLIVGHSSLSHLAAQTFTQRIQSTRNGAAVTIHQSKAIDDLVNGPAVVTVPTPKKESTKQTVPTKNAAGSTQKPTVTPVQQQQHDEAVDTVAKKPTHTIKAIGYRIQVYAGGNSRKDKQTAERIGNELRMLFPTEAVYVHFRSPRWICRMGNFRTQEEATQVLQNVKKLGYSAATIVKGKITLQY